MPKKINLELETKEIKNVNIMSAGEWKGRPFGQGEFDESIKHFNNGVIEPYINIDHNNDLSEDMQKMLDVMSMGFVSRLYRKGTELFADFKQVPKLIAELIEAGALKKKSVEWWHEFKSASGEEFNNVLECVTFFGANGIPAVNTLNDVVKLFKGELQIQKFTDEAGSKETIEYKNKEERGTIMKIEIEKSEYDSLVKFKVEHSSVLVKMKADGEVVVSKMKEDHKKAVEAKDAEITDLKKFKETAEADKKVNLKSEAGAYVDGIIKAEKMLPKFKDMKVADFIRLSGDASEDGKKALSLWKEDMENRDKVVLADAKVDADGNEIVKLKADETDDVKIDQAIKAEMKARDIEYPEAAYRLGVITADEAKAQGFDPKGGK